MPFDLKEAIVTHWPIKVTALALATVLWAAVAAREPTTQIVEVSLIVQPPPGRVVVEHLPRVQASFNGTAGELFKLYLNPPVIRKAVPENYTGSAYLVELSPGDITLQTEAAVSAQWVLPRRIELTLDSAIERVVPVVDATTLLPDSGYELASDIAMEPESVVVRGPRSIVRSITAIRTTAVEITGVTAPINRRIPLDTSGLGTATLSASEAVLSATIQQVVMGSRIVSNVPVRIVPRRGGVWSSDPLEVVVTITGPMQRLPRMTRDSLRATAGPAGAGPRETVRVVVTAPEGITARPNPDSVVATRRDRGS
jgi:YbbR-like protein